MAEPADAKATVTALFDALAVEYDTVVDYFGRIGVRLVDAAGVQSGERVLDLACGRGAVMRPALERAGERGSVVGIDIAPAMVRLLATELGDAPNADVRVGDAEQLSFGDASFDVVTGGFMIFFPPDPRRVLTEILRVLRPGGRAALSVFDGPAGFAFQPELEASVGAASRAPGPNGRFNQAAVLGAGLADVGFTSVATVEVTERFTFDSVDEVERWQRSTGVRRALESLDAERLAAYREGLAARLAAHRDDAGRFVLDQRAVVVTAVAPG